MPADQVRLDLGENAIQELVELARSAHKLREILDSAARIGPQIGTAAVARKISGSVGIPTSELRSLLVAILNFYHTQVRLKLSTSETIEAISRNLKRVEKSQEDKEFSRQWESAKPVMIEALGGLHPDHPLESAYKALRVASSRQYELVGMRIFTDARPVFNSTGDAITQTVISHVLSLDYGDVHEHRVIQFNLDAADLVELRELCERAERKAAVIKQDLSKMPWPTSIFREPDAPNTHGK